MRPVILRPYSLARTIFVAGGILLSLGFATDASAAPSIRFKGGGLDVFNFHGRVALVPATLGGPVDPVRDGFDFDLRNMFGVIYAASVGPGELVDMGKLRYRFKDRPAKHGEGTSGGLYHILNRFRKSNGIWYYTVRIRAYTDLALATEAWMTLIIYNADGPAWISAEWVRRPSGWRLPRNRF